MYCKYCYKFLESNADTCPACGKKQKIKSLSDFLGLFKKESGEKSSKDGINNILYSHEDYYQDTNLSIVSENGLYDFSNFSEHEKFVINNVIKTSLEKYPVEYRSIGLANESSSLKYKARYILFEIIILLYKNSDSLIDKFAVAIAYDSKGADFRSQALEYFESSKSIVSSEITGKFLYFSPFSVFLKFSKLYEKEHEYDKAIELCEMANQYGNGTLSDRVSSLREKMEKPSKKRKRSMTADQEKLEKSITIAAMRFIEEHGLA